MADAVGVTRELPPWYIQRATPQDAKDVRALRLAMLESDEHSYDVDPLLAHQLPLEHWALWVSDNRAVFFATAEGPGDGQRHVGMVAGNIDTHAAIKTAHVGALWVVPSHRTSGIARALLDAIHNWASRESVTRCVLSVAEWNTNAIALYESLGYALNDESVTTRHGHRELVMVLGL
jgi:ribosomal protein S18 acetylase RimI-like enzyme